MKKNKIALVLTNDWELFGDGSGDFFELQYNNLKQFLDLSQKFNAKITIMAEVMQQFAHLDSKDVPNSASITASWEKILQQTISDKHDVQLHIHPQWLNASYTDKWKLNYEHWAISSLKYEEIDRLISKGKGYLESLLKPIDSKYNCQVFRAGSYCIEPAADVIRALKNNGFLADTSVTKDLYSSGFYDFRGAYSNAIPWRTTSETVGKKSSDKEALIELPIYSISRFGSKALNKFFPKIHSMIFGQAVSVAQELAWARERDRVKAIRYPKENRYYKTKQNKDLAFYLSAMLSKEVVQLDYDYLLASEFVRILENIVNSEEYANSGFEVLPIIASGHFKDIHSVDNLKWIFEGISAKLADSVEYWTMTEAVNYIKNKI